MMINDVGHVPDWRLNPAYWTRTGRLTSNHSSTMTISRPSVKLLNFKLFKISFNVVLVKEGAFHLSKLISFDLV